MYADRTLTLTYPIVVQRSAPVGSAVPSFAVLPGPTRRQPSQLEVARANLKSGFVGGMLEFIVHNISPLFHHARYDRMAGAHCARRRLQPYSPFFLVCSRANFVLLQFAIIRLMPLPHSHR